MGAGGRAAVLESLVVAGAAETVRVRLLYPLYAFAQGAPGTPAGVGAVYLGQTCIGTVPLLWGEQE